MKDGRVDHIYRTTIGQGARDVLALHCTLAHSGAWRGVARALGDGVTLHAFDMPSHGRSADWSAGDGDFQDLCAGLADGMLDRPMDLLGHSFGATIALRIAAERPAMVRSLTLIEPVFFAVGLADAPDIVAAHDAEARPFSEAYEAGDAALSARLFNRMWSDENAPRWPDLPDATRAAMTRAIHVVPACRPAIYEDRAALLEAGGLDHLAAPAQLLRGALTHEVIGVINDGLARRLPNGRSLVVPGAGHMLPITHPVQTAQALQALFERAPL